jgi:hypothetical protein
MSMGNFLILPCGCKINETTVLAMCIGHHQQLAYQKIEREARYNDYRRLMDQAAFLVVGGIT